MEGFIYGIYHVGINAGMWGRRNSGTDATIVYLLSRILSLSLFVVLSEVVLYAHDSLKN